MSSQPNRRRNRWHTATRWSANPAERYEQAETDIGFVRTMAIIYRHEFPRSLGKIYIDARTVLQQRERTDERN